MENSSAILGSAGRLSSTEITTRRPLTAAMMKDIADPATTFVGATFKDFASVGSCRMAMAKIRQRNEDKYKGVAATTLATKLGTSAWEARYPGIPPHAPDSVGSWGAYFDRVEQWDAERKQLFCEAIGEDPMVRIISALSTALGRPIERAVHPRYGRRMGMGLVRSGAPHAHFDFAGYDVGYHAIGHIGLVLVLEARPGAVQRVWKHQPEPDEEGNYDRADFMLDPRLTDFIDIPTPIGALSLLSARYIHEVLDDETRHTLAAHIAYLPDGDRWVIYA